MSNVYIKSVPVNLFGGVFNTVISFNNGLNIISGINGTGKTQLLRLLKNNSGNTSDESKKSSDLAIFAINPKRNTERYAIEKIIQQIRTQNKTKQSFLTEISGFQIEDANFKNYPSFVELFIQEYESLTQDGVTGFAEAINKTVKNFNDVLSQVFPGYKIEAKWIEKKEDVAGKLDLKISKYSARPINTEELSTGEREVFALLFCIFASRDKEDIYLIDEPEIHLNWDLEKGLFKFLDWFCKTFEKQIIVATHSRIIFGRDFYPKSQFLVWKNEKIVCSPEITEKQKISIAGEVSETINVVKFDVKTFFVEDNDHKNVVEELAKILKKEVKVAICGNKQNVKSLFDRFVNTDNKDMYFLVDGDGEGCNIIDNRYISLKKQCIENYFLDTNLLSKLFYVSEEDVKLKIIEIIKELNSDKNTILLKKIAEIANPFPFDILDATNGKILIDSLTKKYNKSKSEIIKTYISLLDQEQRLDSVFSEIVIKLKN